MLKRFSVEDRELVLKKNTLLEASAGTGKTYSIENIVARLLMDPETIRLPEILVVTFTKAATRELKERIRQQLERCHALLDSRADQVPDYLQEIIDAGPLEISQARNRLRHALLAYADAKVFTIHGFCYRMLRDRLFEGNFSLDLELIPEDQRRREIKQVVKDAFRTELTEDLLSSEQLGLLLRSYRQDSEQLVEALVRILSQGGEIQAVENYQQLNKEFLKLLVSCIPKKEVRIEDFLADIQNLGGAYKGLCQRNGELTAPIRQAAEAWFSCVDPNVPRETIFERLLSHGQKLIGAFDDQQLKKNAKFPSDEQVAYPGLIQSLLSQLAPLVQKASDPEHIFIVLAQRCQTLLNKVFAEEERLGPDDLLRTMQESLQDPDFAQAVRQQFRAVIVDEFQDTDPIQWEIFRTLFIELKEKAPWLYLVGDPKQSIYRFRFADIYTYFSAARALGPDAAATLDTNYRSHPGLVSALNTVFSRLSRFIGLPLENSGLNYQEVRSGSSAEGIQFSDERKRLCFFLAEGKAGRSKAWPTESMEYRQLFPFIAQEIQRLKANDSVKYRQMAVLVRDRYQSERLAEFLKTLSIPVAVRRCRSLVHSPALEALQELLEACAYPKQSGTLRRALGGKLIGLGEEELRLGVADELIAQFFFLGNTLADLGFAAFFEDFLSSYWAHPEFNVAELLLSRMGGEDLFQELQQLAELLIEEQSRSHCTAEGLIAFLETIKVADESDERFLLPNDQSRDAVQILTLHVSKGLEFDVVFALGLVNRSSQRRRLISAFQDGRGVQLLESLDSEAYRAFCEELDEEKMRQLYVGMTRAKDRLYVPVLLGGSGAPKCKLGELSPMELFLSRLQGEASSWEADYHSTATMSKEEISHLMSSLENEETSLCLLAEENFLLPKTLTETVKELQPPSKVPVMREPVVIQSFTSLARHRELIDEEYRPEESELPLGAETGTIVHEILAKEAFGKPENLERYTRGTHLEGWEGALKELLHNTLTTPLLADASWALQDVAEESCFREMEFLYSAEREAAFVKGFIDLCFEHEGKVYLLDYKTNFLGRGYGLESMKGAMEASDYTLQARIYQEVLARYFDHFHERFGGVFYCFLRGMKGEAFPGSGVYHFFPEESLRCPV